MNTTPLLPDITLDHHPHVLHVRSDIPLAVVSSAVLGGELAETQHILNLHVPPEYECGDHLARLREHAAALGIAQPFVGLLTAASLERVQVIVERDGPLAVAAIVTVGVRHPTTAGVTPAAPPLEQPAAGTINTIVLIDAALPPAARVNAVITATEAKALVMVESGLAAPHGGLATGTGTDATVVASTQRGAQEEYAGPIAPVGALVGRAVRRATQDGIAAWRVANHR